MDLLATPIDLATQTVLLSSEIATVTELSSQTVQPVPAPAPQQETSSGAGWLWILAIVLVAAAAAVLVILKPGRKKQPADKAARVEAIGPTVPATAPMGAAAGPAYMVGCAQTIGGRPYQEDSYGVSDWRNPALTASRGVLGIMADGVGGLKNGQAASSTVVRTMLNVFAQQDASKTLSNRLLEMVSQAQTEVLKLNQQGSNSGSTLISALIKGYNLCFLTVGDSRISLYRAGGLLHLNREHVLGREADEDAAMGRGPAVTDERRRKAITAYMGKEKLTLMDRNVQPIRLMPGDRVVLMSDGVFGALDDATIISKLRLSPEEAARAIIAAVDEKKLPHQDNATVVVIGVG